MTAWNPADAEPGAWSFSGGDLLATVISAASWVSVRATDAVDAATADHYFEVDVTSFSSFAMVGICSSSASLGYVGFWYGADGWGYFSTGQKYNNNTGASYGSSYGVDRIGVHLKAGKLYFLLNGVYQNSGDPDAGTGYAYDGITGDVYPVLSLHDTGDAATGAFTAVDLVDLPTGADAWDGSGGSSVTGEIVGDVPLIAGEFVGLLVPTGEMAGDLVGVAGSFGGDSGAIGVIEGELLSIAGDFPGGQGFFAALAGDVPGIGGDIVGLVAQSGELAGDLPLIAGEFIGGYSVAGGFSGDLPLIAGSMAGFTVVGASLIGDLPLIAGSFVGGMATVGALAGDLPGIAGAFNDGPVGVIGGSLPLISGDALGYVGTAAAGRWIYIHTVPPAQVYAIDAVRGRLRPWLPMHRASRLELSATAAQIGARNDSFTVTLSGIGSALRSRLAAQAPFGVRVDVMDGGEVSRSGIVSDIGNSADKSIVLECESQGWTTDLPLRTNADLGVFRDVQVLPRRYGRAVPGRCVRLGQTGKQWLWADHASERISSVQIDGQDYGAWQWRNDTDAAGNPVTLITTADEIDDGAELIAVGDGIRDSLSGALIVNPADMVYDLCQWAGVAVDRGDLVPFRAECQTRALEISGSIDGGTLQQAMVTLADSVYAVFSRELAGFMRLLPRTGATLTIPAADTPTAKAARDAIATRLRVRYALEDSNPRASLEVRAVAVEAVRGVSSADVTLHLVRDSRVALDVATRILADRSRPAYTVPAARQRSRIVPGIVVSASVPALSLSGEALVTASQITETGSTPTMLLRVGAAPTITLAAQSTAYTPQQYAAATVASAGDVREITITGTDGRPIVGAACTLDGSLVRTSDNAGRVTFPAASMPPGPHTIVARASGMQPLTFSVVVQ